MSQTTSVPYINFNGRTREALTFYQQAFGGDLSFKAMTPNGPQLAGPADRIMHGSLKSGDICVMGTDGTPNYPLQHGENIAIALTGNNVEQLIVAFNKLAEGGEIMQALEKESWGDTFGFVVDKFGINWMINITSN